MLDEEGKEVPGTKGYKYFGRAKELPGVKELFQKSKEPDEETLTQQYYKKFQNQGPAYFGDFDEADGTLLEFEKTVEEAEWEDAFASLQAVLGIPCVEGDTPKIPRPDPVPFNAGIPQPAASQSNASSASADVQMADPGAESLNGGGDHDRGGATNNMPLLSILDPSDLEPPKMPTKEEMEGVLLGLRKRALMEEYLGGEAVAT
jgi:pre-mRNA-splicing factor ISY1